MTVWCRVWSGGVCRVAEVMMVLGVGRDCRSRVEGLGR